jgi:hypothetical protein
MTWNKHDLDPAPRSTTASVIPPAHEKAQMREFSERKFADSK